MISFTLFHIYWIPTCQSSECFLHLAHVSMFYSVIFMYFLNDSLARAADHLLVFQLVFGSFKASVSLNPKKKNLTAGSGLSLSMYNNDSHLSCMWFPVRRSLMWLALDTLENATCTLA